MLQAKQIELNQLRLNLTENFNFEELQTLCFDLRIDYEMLPHRTKGELARELIVHLLYKRCLHKLLEHCQAERPHITWPMLTDTISQIISAETVQEIVESGQISHEESLLLQKLERFLRYDMIKKFAPASKSLLLNHLPTTELEAHTRVNRPGNVFDTLDMCYLRNSLATSFGVPNDALLILGKPEARKSFMLVELAQIVVESMETVLVHPTPMVFNLASWARKCQSIVSWIASELHTRYTIPEHISNNWISQNGFVILMKGFDELPKAMRTICKMAIVEFQMAYGLTRLAVAAPVNTPKNDRHIQPNIEHTSLQAVAFG